MRRSGIVELCHEKVPQVVAEWAQVLHKRYQPGFISALAAPSPARKAGCAGAVRRALGEFIRSRYSSRGGEKHLGCFDGSARV